MQPSDLSPIESVDSAAMRSRLHAMQRRIESLEREKMELSMSKAPLEARMRQREDAWVRERERLCAEIEKTQQENVHADERYRELEMKNEALEEQNARLRLEARAASSKIDGIGGAGGSVGSGTSDPWSERLKINNEIKDLRQELKNKVDEINSLRIAKVSLESDVYASHTEINTLIRNYDELEKDYRELESSKSQNTEAEIQLQFLTTEHTAMTAQLNATCADLEEIKVRAKADLQAKEDTWKEREKRLLFEMSVIKSRAGKTEENDVGVSDEDPAILKARIEERDRRIAELEEKLLSGEQLRRALHNRIQELRGNIRVYVRTRPFLPTDGTAARHSSIEILPDGESLTIMGKHVGEGHAFKFDKVFAPSTGQDMVFEEVSEFVQSALDGYHVCLFSYGQTGSGKTHTMQGSGNGAMRGIIPRAVEQILSQALSMQSQRWTFTMKASFLEIYNEELRDLLIMVNSDGSIKPRDTRTAPKLSIKRNADGKSFVDGINMVDIDVTNRTNGMAQLEAVISAAARARSVATTKMNAQSSRSHSVFMLQLCGINDESGTTVQGALNLCDLAGSERLDRSGAASDAKRLKETQAINKSLSCLGDVFTSLANGSKHVPFRNSKLTFLLQDCLSGDGKALMFVNLSPTYESSNESLCSLRFAQRVNQVELGKATKHVQYGGKGSSSVRPTSK
jgi:kinesin family protein C1